MFKIREFQPTKEEYDAITAIEAAIWEDNASSAKEFAYFDQTRDKAYRYERYVVEQAGQIMAFGHWRQQREDGRYRLRIFVHPEFERQGIGTAVYDHFINLIRQQTPAPTIIESGTYSHKPQSVRFLQKRGFSQVMRWVISLLDVQSFNIESFAGLEQKISDRGIEFISLPKLGERDANWQRAIYELDWEIAQDEPLPYAPQKPPFELYQKHEFENPNQILEAWFVAIDNGRYVGMTQLFRTDDPTLIKTGFTGTVRSHRRRGIATLLKAKAINYAKQSGVQALRTGNEENNPMLLLNKKLGFKELTANLAFEKKKI